MVIMVDFDVMIEDLKKIWLVGATLVFSLIGLMLAWYTFTLSFLAPDCWSSGRIWKEGENFDYKGETCLCNEGKILCEVEDRVIADSDLEMDDFTSDGLNFSPRFVSSSISAELELASLKTVFKSIKNFEKGVEVVLQQAQLCSSTSEPPVQFGLYHASNTSLVLMSVINTAPTLYNKPCTVESTFRIEGLEYDVNREYTLSYRSEAGELVAANICSYDGKLFNHGDRYEAVDRCNICRCDHGISRCSNDRMCNN